MKPATYTLVAAAGDASVEWLKTTIDTAATAPTAIAP